MPLPIGWHLGRIPNRIRLGDTFFYLHMFLTAERRRVKDEDAEDADDSENDGKEKGTT